MFLRNYILFTRKDRKFSSSFFLNFRSPQTNDNLIWTRIVFPQEVSDFPLTPALSALIKTDQLDFIVHVGVIAVKETCPRIRENAGKLLAELVKAKLLSKLIVYLGWVEQCRMRVLVYKHSNFIVTHELVDND